MSDLVVLVPDKNLEATVKGLLSRHQSLSVRQLNAHVHVHPARDPGCLKVGPDFLRAFSSLYRHGLILLDRDGRGSESQSREQLESDIEFRLDASGWNGRAKAIVLDPELEVWVWSESPHLSHFLGWTADAASLRQWLIDQGYLTTDRPKPDRPKDAVEKLLRRARLPRSSSRYFELAQKISLHRCEDRAFLKFKETLLSWFPAS
jgi:hypothetical protein